MQNNRLVVVFGASLISGCGMPSAPIGSPSSTLPLSEGAVVDVSRIITELKCNVRDWQTMPKPPGDSSRMVVGDVGVKLGLSYNRVGSGSIGGAAGVPISPVTIKLSASQSTESKTESAVALAFVLSQEYTKGKKAPAETINCNDMASRLPEPIIPLRALADQINRSPSGTPYFGWAGNPEIKGKFYFKRVREGGFQIVSVPISLDVAKGSRTIE